MSEDSSSFKCNTCKACFASTEKIKDHYRSEWHVFNSKRRANGLIFLRKEDFKLLVSEKKSPIKSINSIPTESICDEVTTANDVEKNEIKPVKVYEPKLGANVSIFDDKEFENVDDCVQYMALNFGFFIPDIEYLCDLEGFIKYMNEKVKVGGYCLYCQRQFQAGHPTQHHMISKSHCKVAYENGVDGEEYEDFYDFSASYEDLDDADIELDEDGEIVEKKIEIARTGELVLPSGKIVGHRDFRVYYKQYYRPEETRTCVLAQQREELLRLGCKFSGEGASSLSAINELSDSEVMVKLVKFQKQVRRGMMVEQRAMQRAELIAQRREYKSTKDKLRASENTTAKIRDYHKLL